MGGGGIKVVGTAPAVNCMVAFDSGAKGWEFKALKPARSLSQDRCAGGLGVQSVGFGGFSRPISLKKAPLLLV